MLEKIKTYAPWVIASLAIAAALWAWYHPQPVPPQGQKEFVEAEVPGEYKDEPTAQVPLQTQNCVVTTIVKTVPVIQREWPDWFQKNDDLQLTAIGLVKPYRGETECASIINLQTGDSRIVTRQLPVPLFGFENTLYIGGLYGMNNSFMVNAGWNFARVGSFYPSIGVGYMQGSGQSVFVPGIGGTFLFE